MQHKIGIIGFGNMGSAIAEQLKNNYKVMVFEKDSAKTAKASGILVAKDLSALIRDSDTLILAVKPQDFPQVFLEIKDSGHELDKLVISIAAGIPTTYIEEHFGVVRVIRVMPNIPAKINAGMICLTKGKFASEEDLDFAQELFDYLGETLIIKEELMDEVTATSGSGPGFICRILHLQHIDPNDEVAISNFEKEFIPSFTASAEEIGIPKEKAEILVSATTAGTIALLRTSHMTPEQLEKQVVSKK
ncbi:MAG: pyrroline-5-carboxylate reductase, partial [Candidatus Omnitrophica bacterium]|nr:pyrroline-5-carboxylate reductase [Candidatus Omnitrophota bacterium]